MNTTKVKSIKDDARIFLTDYASYNQGTQFEFGHWVELDQFNDAEELNEYINAHFEEADEKSPLACGSEREEIMITDFEGFPSELYDECMNFETLFEYFDRAESCAYDTEVIEAFASVGSYSLDNIDDFFDALEDAYTGQYDSDKDFAEDYADNFGLIDENAAWPMNCIDWEWAARNLMFDYYESNGHYFRQI